MKTLADWIAENPVSRAGMVTVYPPVNGSIRCLGVVGIGNLNQADRSSLWNLADFVVSSAGFNFVNLIPK